MTQGQLSFRTGLSRPHISQLERDLNTATFNTLFLICDALDASAPIWSSGWTPRGCGHRFDDRSRCSTQR